MSKESATQPIGSQHARTGPSGPSVPEPSFAERVRTLLYLARTGHPVDNVSQASRLAVWFGHAVCFR